MIDAQGSDALRSDAAFDAIRLIDAWTEGASAHLRLDRLLRALVPDEAIDFDTLGQRNQRLLRLAAGLEGDGALEGVATCPACGEDSEFELPADALLALPPPAATSADLAGITLRLPRMADLLADDPTPLLARCADAPLTAEAARAAGDALDALDPAAHVVLDLACAACGTRFDAEVDIAGFVAARVDRALASLLAQIDVIAGSYGWSEAAIAALPPRRRRAYVTMINQRSAVPVEALA